MEPSTGTSRWELPSQRQTGHGQLCHLLWNPISVGKRRHHNLIYDGAYVGVLEPAIFDAVQMVLCAQSPERRFRSNSRDLHLLTGLVFDDMRDRRSPMHASTHGNRYRYHVFERLKIGTSDGASGYRVPAGELEGIAPKQARDLLRDRSMITDGCRTI